MGISSGFPRFQGWNRPPSGTRPTWKRPPSGSRRPLLWFAVVFLAGAVLAYVVVGLDSGGEPGVATFPDPPGVTEARLTADDTLEVDVVGPQDVHYCLRAAAIRRQTAFCARSSDGTVVFTDAAIGEVRQELAGSTVAVTLRARLGNTGEADSGSEDVRYVESEPSDPVEVLIAG